MLLMKLMTYFFYLWSEYLPTVHNNTSSFYNAYRLFASKTAYEQIRNKEEAHEIKYQGCSMKQLYFLSRHGTRYPPTKGMTHMSDKLPHLRDIIVLSGLKHTNGARQVNLDESLLHALKEWRFSFDIDYGMKLAPTGYNEYLDLGTRLRQRFPFLIEKNFSADLFDIMFTSTERTKQSIHQLLVGMFNEKVDDKDLLENGENDKLLRFYDICGKTSADFYEGVEEVSKFLDGPEIVTVQQNITDRLGLDYCPSFESIFMMYDICRYETALKPSEFSPWCALFQTEELKILEYSEDLESYYRSGYPYSVHYERACLIIKDIVDHFNFLSPRPPMENPTLFKLLLLINALNIIASKKSCYSEVQEPYKLFASKTAYDESRGWNSRKVSFEGCEPKQFYLLCRHGTRYPDRDDIEELERRLPELKVEILLRANDRKGKLCQKDVDNLRGWSLNLDPSIDENLAPAGEQELHEIGARFKRRFPSLFSKPYSSDTYDIRFTTTERTNSSARHFLIGVFGDEGKKIPFSEKNVDDNLLRFYKTCQKWKKNVDKNPNAILEVEDFDESSKMEDLIEDVSKRLGLKWKLSEKDIDLIYDMCRYEAAWDRDKVSPWCAAFKPKELKILEYNEDLKYYYKHGYAYPINYEQACPPVRDLVNHFRASMDEEPNEPLGLFRFSHSGMMLKTYARLGLYQDDLILTSKNFKQQDGRKWRASYMDTFSSNLAFVLLKCGDDFKVASYAQEKEIKLPGCKDFPCSVDDFLKIYEPIADQCNVTKTCSL